MKILVRQHNQCTSKYRRFPEGKEVVCATEDLYESVASLEDIDFFPQESGVVYDASGNEVFDPNYPDSFDYGDYSYYLIESNDLNEDDDMVLLTAINEL